MAQQIISIVDFSKNTDISLWNVVDDVVMGGVSCGNFTLNKEGYGSFYGKVSTDNNGGFSSLQHKFNTINVKLFKKIVIEVKGDGKNYQFRIKDKLSNYYSYIFKFSTSTKWQTIKINLSEMYPAFRGKKLSKDNFNTNTISQVAFLIANKKNENFQLKLKRIYLE